MKTNENALLTATTAILEAIDHEHELGRTLLLTVDSPLVRDLRNAICDAEGCPEVEEQKLDVETTPKGAKIPSRKTNRQELESLGWELINSGKKGDMYRHRETRELAKRGPQGFASLLD